MTKLRVTARVEAAKPSIISHPYSIYKHQNWLEHLSRENWKNSMSAETPPNQNRSISVGGSVQGSAFVTGDSNTVSVQFQQASLPQPESVNIKAEVAALREALLQLQAPDQRKIERALEDVDEELKKPEPEKDEVGQALERAVNYAQKANGFAEAIDKLRPHVEKVAAWLGENWYKLLPLVGLTV